MREEPFSSHLFNTPSASFTTNSILDIYVTIECTLAELYQGCTKHRTFIRRTRVNNQSLSMLVHKDVVIERGMKHLDRIIFGGEGEFNDEQTQSGDLIFVIEQATRDTFGLFRFGTNGEHLSYTHSISLKDALTSNEVSVEVNLLGLKMVHVKIDNSENVISPQYVHV